MSQTGTVVVQKYGGSSVADPKRIRKVAERIAATRAAGHRVVVVVSAMGDTTDELLRLAKEVTASPSRRELDMLLTAGERIAMALLSLALNDLGVEAISFTGSQSGIITNDAHAGARILEVRPYRIQDELERDRVVIVAGYQGVSYRKEVTTLGRGGSDTTAVALAAALGAEYCEICSDVDGVYTGDPRVVESAQRLEAMTHEEMQTLAECGARVLNATAVEYARRKDIAIWARATASPPGDGVGTLVRVGGPEPGRRVAGVTSREVLLLQAEGVSAAQADGLSRALAAQGLGARWLSWGGPGASLVALVATEDLHDLAALRQAVASVAPGASVETGLAAVSVVGAGLDAAPEILGQVLEAARGLQAEVRHLERSALRLTLVVAAEHEQALTRAVHAALVG